MDVYLLATRRIDGKSLFFIRDYQLDLVNRIKSYEMTIYCSRLWPVDHPFNSP